MQDQRRLPHRPVVRALYTEFVLPFLRVEGLLYVFCTFVSTIKLFCCFWSEIYTIVFHLGFFAHLTLCTHEPSTIGPCRRVVYPCVFISVSRCLRCCSTSTLIMTSLHICCHLLLRLHGCSTLFCSFLLIFERLFDF